MTWMILTPRELELLQRDVWHADARTNSDLLRTIQKRIKGEELELTGAEIEMVKKAAKNWRGGWQQQMQAVLSAAERHP